MERFEYVKIPADPSINLSVRTAEAGWAGDQLPEILRAEFAGGGVSEQAIREHAHRHLGEQAGALDVDAFRAAVADGSVETFALVHPCEEESHEGVYAHMDECGLLKGLPRNERACSLASACGFDGAAFHGDVFVGRVRTKPEPMRNISFGLKDMSSDAQWLRRAPAANLAHKLEMARIDEAIEKNRRAQEAKHSGEGESGSAPSPDGDATPCLDDRERCFWWAQEGGEVEVRVPLPDGLRARDISVALAPTEVACDVRGSQEPPLLRVGRLHAPIRAGESTWEVRDADESDLAAGTRAGSRVLVLTLVKLDGSAHWPQLRATDKA